MKKIIVAALLMVISMGVCATSFVVNDLQRLNTWYMQNVFPLEKEHVKFKQEMKQYKMNIKEHTDGKYNKKS